MAGLKPRGFRWVIKGRLAVCERIGGHGFQHRRVRREEEIIWLAEAGVNSVVSLLSGNQNQAAYEASGLRYLHAPVGDVIETQVSASVFEKLDEAMSSARAVVLVHRDLIDDVVVGLLGGYLVHSKMIEDQIVAATVIQEIAGRPLGPEGRRLIPGQSVRS